MTPSENISKLAPFLLRSRSVEVGRDRLLQVRNKLLFLLATEDLSDNSLKKTLLQFSCPVVQCFTSTDLEKLFKFYGTKLIGFRRSSLSNAVLKELSPFRLHAQNDGIPPRPLPLHPKVAVLGLHGIGRHHAFWWNHEGAEVCAFLCHHPENIPSYTADLNSQFVFQGQGYTVLQELLETARPDIVDVCLPDSLHFAAVNAALQAGCHVLCEKPFVYDPKLSADILLEQAETLHNLALSKRSLLGISSQYAVVIRKCLNLRQDQSRPPDYLDCTVISPGRKGSPSPMESWFDLGTHVLAAAQISSRPGILTSRDLRFTADADSATVEFSCRRPDSSRLFRGRLTTRYQQAPAQSLRRIRLDQETFLLENALNSQKLFQMNIHYQDQIIPWEDPLQLLIRSFLKNHLELPSRMAIQNLNMLLSARTIQ